MSLSDAELKRLAVLIVDEIDRRKLNGYDYSKPIQPFIPTQPFMPEPGTPWTPTMPSVPSDWPVTMGTKSVCPKCGINLSNPMSYACVHSNCPCGLGPINCCASSGVAQGSSTPGQNEPTYTGGKAE